MACIDNISSYVSNINLRHGYEKLSIKKGSYNRDVLQGLGKKKPREWLPSSPEPEAHV